MLQQVQLSLNALVVSFASYRLREGGVFWLHVRSTPQTDACAVRAMQKYLAVRGRKPGPLFTDRFGNAVVRSEFDKVMKRAIVFNRIDPAHFKGHSFRIGAASAVAGIPDSQIREMGRWKSDALSTSGPQPGPQHYKSLVSLLVVQSK